MPEPAKRANRLLSIWTALRMTTRSSMCSGHRTLAFSVGIEGQGPSFELQRGNPR
jgi:hypothetical protein